MKRILILCLALAGCGESATNAYLRDQLRGLSKQTRPSFDNPGDAMSLAPTADNGPFTTEATHDCSSCPPR